MLVLDELWAGTLAPCAKAFYDQEDCRAASQRHMEADRRLRAELSGGQLALLDREQSAGAELEGVEQREMFYYGFRMGARLILDILE